MIHDEFEYDIAASMDDLENLDLSAPPTILKSSKFQKTPLPEIDENSTFDSGSGEQSSATSTPSEPTAEATPTKLKKSVSISDNELPQRTREDNDNNNHANHNHTANAPNHPPSNNPNDKLNNNDERKGNVSNAKNTVAGTHRKFIVTRMDSNAILRPEAENLRNLTEKTNAATIQFPCSSGINHRPPLAGLFASNTLMGPHLDRRFFDSSLVEVRLTADSTQSLNVASEHTTDGHSIWERQKVEARPKVNLRLSTNSAAELLASLPWQTVSLFWLKPDPSSIICRTQSAMVPCGTR